MAVASATGVMPGLASAKREVDVASWPHLTNIGENIKNINMTLDFLNPNRYNLL
jgi:hypothetical protein